MPVNLHGRRFRDTANPHAPLATYHVSGRHLTGEYANATTPIGRVAGYVNDDGTVVFGYMSVDNDGTLIVGVCHSTVEVRADGLIQLNEKFERFLPMASTGESTLLEVTDEP